MNNRNKLVKKDFNEKGRNMKAKVLTIGICAVSLLSLQGCFVSHTKTVEEVPVASSQTTTTVDHQPGDAVSVTTTH